MLTLKYFRVTSFTYFLHFRQVAWKCLFPQDKIGISHARLWDIRIDKNTNGAYTGVPVVHPNTRNMCG